MQTAPRGAGGAPDSYRERLSPPLGVWLTAYALALGVLPICLPVMPLPAVLGLTALAYVVVTFAVRSWAAEVVLERGELRAGSARIPVSLLGAPTAHDAEASALLRGRDIEPRAYHLIRAWVPTAVTVPVQDPADSTPYWYVATRHPEALAAALVAAQGRATTA
ncbi:DUF3093 domain-containing protein [Motilibacter peucedani]|nr:DUF3093 domain-containing protein [Motilibacter peucedani]